MSADGGYDRRTCYEAIAGRGAKAAIPPRRGAKIWQHGNSKQERLARDENLRRIRQVGRAKWKRESGYHRRSLAETAMFRLKTIFGAALRARSEAAQDTETMLRLNALNKMTALGMPDTYCYDLCNKAAQYYNLYHPSSAGIWFGGYGPPKTSWP